MKFIIISSKKDIAGMNIADCLIRSFPFKEERKSIYSLKHSDKEISLHIIEEDSIYYDKANELDADYFIFASRHVSKNNDKALTIHFPGNFSDAKYGGQDNELCVAATCLLKQAFINLNNTAKDSEYNITLEATHHGPLLKKPVMFIELGSTIQEWKDKAAAELLARTIMKTISEYEKKAYETAICFGGLHYCQNFKEIILNENTAFGHICPKYNLGNINESMIMKMINASDLPITYALLDWKGITGEEKQKLVAILEKLNIPWKKTKDA